MSTIQKLTVDDAGKLRGGFSLQSIRGIGTVYAKITNINCNKGGSGIGNNDDEISNVNCSCGTCGSDTKTEYNLDCPVFPEPKP